MISLSRYIPIGHLWLHLLVVENIAGVGQATVFIGLDILDKRPLPLHPLDFVLLKSSALSY